MPLAHSENHDLTHTFSAFTSKIRSAWGTPSVNTFAPSKQSTNILWSLQKLSTEWESCDVKLIWNLTTHWVRIKDWWRELPVFWDWCSLTASTFFHACCCKKKSKLQNCNTRMQTKSTCLWMKNAFQVGKKNPREKQRKAWTKSTSLHSNQDCVSEKIWERRASLNFCKWNWKKRMWGACMYACFTLIDQWQAPGIW